MNKVLIDELQKFEAQLDKNNPYAVKSFIKFLNDNHNDLFRCVDLDYIISVHDKAGQVMYGLLSIPSEETKVYDAVFPSAEEFYSPMTRFYELGSQSM